ncbi:hypothetical protein QA641_39465 [Bradyrhizobium sp. CB1650]|uniref:hypothetical protein n=1 Tax=Bradyrhizobium sp. CB1650 TaxID=3039153 RepID=UPI002434A8EA|nr:hypothetical protein [Bradyrhizobium sp. CB1650]WGD51464.1 hypothetical protein QA641_39465 [Bradyrhizobium sp. CB1650]
MADDKPSTEARVYAVADALLLEHGGLDGVRLADVVSRAGGRKQNVARYLNSWRSDREMMAARLQGPALRAAYRYTRDLLLILMLGQRPGVVVTAPAASPRDEPPSGADAPQPTPAPEPRGAARRDAVPRSNAAASRDIAPHLAPVGAATNEARRTFLAGYAERVAERASNPAVNARPPDAPKGRPRSWPTNRPPRPKRPPTRRSFARPPESPTAKAARLARIRAYVMRERADAYPPMPVVDSDWQGAAKPKVARAVAFELRAGRRPMAAKALIKSGRIPLTTNRPYRDLAAALAGSRITRVPGRRGAYWFDYEPAPRPRKVRASDDSDAKLVREFGRLLWVRLVVAIAVSPSPLARRDIAASLEPELSDLSPVWLAQCLKRGKKAGAFEMRGGGYVIARPRASRRKTRRRARTEPAARVVPV